MTIYWLDNYSLLNISIRSFVLLLITFAVALACRRNSAAVIHLIWTLGICGCLVVLLVTLLVPDWTLPILPPAASVRFAATQSKPTIESMPGDKSPPRAIDGRVQPVSSESVPSRFEWPSLATCLFVAWSAGLAVVLSRLMQQVLQVQRIVRQCKLLDSDAWLKLRDAAAEKLGVRMSVVLMSHPEAVSPMVAGLLRPVVMLPAGAEKWSVERRMMVLMHELAHIQRHDVLTQTVAGFTCAVYWFNPLAWLGTMQMQRLRELACDDAVVAHTPKPSDYAQTLLDVAKDYRSRQQICAVAMACTNPVTGRIAAILDSTRRRANLTRRAARLAAAAALFLSVLVGSLQLSSHADDPKEPQNGQQTSLDKVNESRTKALTELLTLLESSSGTSEFTSRKLAQHLTLAAYGSADHTKVERRLSEALASLGRLRCIRSAIWTKPDAYPELSSPKRLRLTLEIDHRKLLSELATLVDACAGQKGVVTEVLRGIATDPTGPQVDVEKELLSYLGDRLIIINDTEGPRFRWLIAISVDDRGTVARAIYRLLRKEADARLAGRNSYSVNNIGVVVAQNWLIVGESSLVQDTFPNR